MDYKDFKKGKELQHSLTLKEYGNYGDIFSEDLSALAFQRPEETKQLLKIKMRNIINRMKYDFTKTFKEDIGNDDNYAETAIIKERRDLFKTGQDENGTPHAEIL